MKFQHSLRDNSVFSENIVSSKPVGVATYKTTTTCWKSCDRLCLILKNEEVVVIFKCL